MDSGNSSSLQSSSGGDEENDSRVDPNSTNLSPLSSLYPSLTSPSIDPLFLYLDAITRSLPPTTNTEEVSFNPPPKPPPPPPAASPSSSRNSKKRPRTSRRELTTVLTTDTTNFRTMVQEFTGLPTLPSLSTLPAISPFSLFKPFPSSSSPSSMPNFLSPPRNSIPELLNVLNIHSCLQTSAVQGSGRVLQGTAAMAGMNNAEQITGGGKESEILQWSGGALGSIEYCAEKETNSVPTSGKGTVDSWIDSSQRRS